jgi:primosomal protein N' (replication factor Y)
MLTRDGPFHGQVQVMGPIEAPLARIANHHRWQILVNSPDTAMLHRFVHELVLGRRAKTAGRQVNVSIDVDPLLLM